MDELIDLVAKKAGISQTQARKAVNTVIDFLNDKLPPPIGGNLDDYVKGNVSQDTIDQITKGLGGLFGNK
ncbi:MAG: DUF2267 domain-containing protein [Chloroflexota bacterium]